jgi:hypothetical protein
LPRWALLLVFGILAAAAVGQSPPQTPTPLPPTPLRPGGDSGPTRVHYAIWIADISHIDSVAQTFSASLVVLLRWHDPKLAHAGPGAKRFNLDEIWHPELLIANEADALDRSMADVADVAPDGTAVHRQRFVGTFGQALNLRSFPFDRDTFRVRFATPGHRPGEIVFVPDEKADAAGFRNGLGLSRSFTLPDWKIISATARVEPCAVTPRIEFAGFVVELAAARDSQHFVLKVIIPLILIVAMSWAVFWIEPNDANTQMAVAVTAMLTLIAYRFAIDGDVPKLPYLTRLDAFVLMSTVLVFLSIIEVMVTTKLASMDRTSLARTIDRRSRWAFPVAFSIATAIILLR